MSFIPTSKTSLLGIVEPIRSIGLLEEGIHESKAVPFKDKYGHTIIVIVISAIIFVTVVAIYDVLRHLVTNYYASQSLRDPNSNNTPEDISQTEVANRSGLISSLIFAVLVVISALILVPLLVRWDKRHQ